MHDDLQPQLHLAARVLVLRIRPPSYPPVMTSVVHGPVPVSSKSPSLRSPGSTLRRSDARTDTTGIALTAGRHTVEFQYGGAWSDEMSRLRRPTSFEADNYLGNISFGRQDLDKAKGRYDQALSIRPNYPDAGYGLGHVYWRQNQTDLALEQFDKVVRLRPGFGDAYLARGDIHAKRRLFVDARSDYEKAIGAYEAQLKNLNDSIAFAEAHSQSRAAQAQKKRDERDKERTETLLATARHSLAQLGDDLRTQ